MKPEWMTSGWRDENGNLRLVISAGSFKELIAVASPNLKVGDEMRFYWDCTPERGDQYYGLMPAAYATVRMGAYCINCDRVRSKKCEHVQCTWSAWRTELMTVAQMADEDQEAELVP